VRLFGMPADARLWRILYPDDGGANDDSAEAMDEVLRDFA
jgi:hypothetical protein